MPRSYVPDRGDAIWISLNPQTGHEQAGRRPAVVLSPASYNSKVGLAIVCPITSAIRNFGTSVILPDGLAVGGEVLTSHVRSIDLLARPIRFAGGVAPPTTLVDVREKLAVLCGM